ncbi:hypothetical protein chiPu_0030986 [Chiloscyllium punctatum]|uniref:Uncharacterized protein n=1 Tax=Chiloscyllium punctatum TaxID=137246 RepID=A0A401TVH3_CHIPU|nr:hypothetical protein [Chiloscyllium punctatum]
MILVSGLELGKLARDPGFESRTRPHCFSCLVQKCWRNLLKKHINETRSDCLTSGWGRAPITANMVKGSTC